MFLTSVSSVIYQTNKIVLDFSGPRQCLWNTACRLSRRAAGSWKICAERLVQGVNCTQCTFSWVHRVSSKLLGVGTACESTAITFFFFSSFFSLAVSYYASMHNKQPSRAWLCLTEAAIWLTDGLWRILSPVSADSHKHWEFCLWLSKSKSSFFYLRCCEGYSFVSEPLQNIFPTLSTGNG